MSARFDLKAATDDAHQQLDSTLARLNLAEPGDYARFLAIHAAVVPALEQSLSDAGIEELVPGWTGARRSPALLADLAAFGIALPEAVKIGAMGSTAETLGTAYVLEGSRLGGQLLARDVGSDLPSAYLAASSDLAGWRKLVAALDQHLDSDAAFSQASAAANGTFAAFMRSAHTLGLEVNG